MLKKLAFGVLAAYRRLRLAWLALRGQTPDGLAEKRIVTGKSWDEFCDSLKAAGAALNYPGAPRDAFNQAEGYRYLSRLLRAGLEAFVEYADPAFPVLRRMVHETVKMGADNPDNFYLNAKISGDYEYRIHGKRNTIHYLGFGTQRGDYGTTGGLQPAGYLDADDMSFDADGSYEIIVSRERRGQNWLPSTPDTSMLIVRQSRLDPATESLAEIHIERIGAEKDEGPAPLTARAMDDGLNSVSALVAGASMLFARWTRGFQRHVNTLPQFDEKVSNAAGGVADIAYYHSYWQLAADEALVIEAMPPVCDHWNFQVNNHWMESLDYRYHRIHLNSKTASYEADGSIRIIVAHRDPGLPNWLSTDGHLQGTMCFRWVKSEQKPEPQTRVMPFAQLKTLSENHADAG